MEKVALFGLPASGKGTLAQAMRARWGWEQLSTGDMIRRMRAQPGPVGDALRALPTGSFADDGLMVEAVAQELRDPKYARGVVFDGFPRTVAQLTAMGAAGQGFDAALLLSAPEDALVGRAVARRVHVASGRVYNLVSAPPKAEGLDDETGEPLEWRDDDREEVVRRRFADYWSKTDPVVRAVRAMAESGRVGFATIDAMGGADEVWAAAEAALRSMGLDLPQAKPKMG